jgi:hypothetical protein
VADRFDDHPAGLFPHFYGLILAHLGRAFAALGCINVYSSFQHHTQRALA